MHDKVDVLRRAQEGVFLVHLSSDCCVGHQGKPAVQAAFSEDRQTDRQTLVADMATKKNTTYEADPSENCHLNVKNLSKT